MNKDNRAPLEHQQTDEINAVFHIFIKKDGRYRLNFSDSVFSVDERIGSMQEVIRKIIMMYEDTVKKTINLKKMAEEFERIRYNRKLNNKGYHTFCDTCRYESKQEVMGNECGCSWGDSLRTGWIIKKKLTLKDLSNWKTGQNFKISNDLLPNKSD